MRKAGLEEAQTEIKITRRNISNLRYADDITLMAESEEELKSLLMKVKAESEKVVLKLNIQKLRLWHLVPSVQFSSFQLLSHVQYFETPWIATDQSSLSIVNFRVYSNSSPLSQ